MTLHLVLRLRGGARWWSAHKSHKSNGNNDNGNGSDDNDDDEFESLGKAAMSSMGTHAYNVEQP